MNHLKQFLSSYKLTICLLFLYALILGIATFVEKYEGTDFAQSFFYHSPLLIILQFVMVLNFIFIVIEKKLWKSKKWAFLLLHISFIIILLGAMTSFIFSEEGFVHIREGEKTNKMMIKKDNEIYTKDLPFHFELEAFKLQRYPGSSSPSSYESHLKIHHQGGSFEKVISMNNVLDLEGYRFFQTSFDKDEKGTVLTVNKDVAGRTITYIGYFILLIGFLGILFSKNSRLHILNKKLNLYKEKMARPLCLIFILLLPNLLSASNDSLLVNFISEKNIDPSHAERFGALAILSTKGRIEPMNTFASEILRKLHKDEKVNAYDPNQFMLSLLAYPNEWMHLPFINVSNNEIAVYYDLSKNKCAYIEAFDEKQQYKLSPRLEDIFRKPAQEQTRFDKDLLKLDEQFNIFHLLINYQLINIYPNPANDNSHWYAPGENLSVYHGSDSIFVSQIFPTYIKEVRLATETNDWTKADKILDSMISFQKEKSSELKNNAKKIEYEILYNKLNVFKDCKKAYLIGGGFLLIMSFISIGNKKKWLLWALRGLYLLIFIFFLYHLFGIAVRGFIAGYAPWSNSYETMIYVSWITVLGGFLFIKKSPMTFALATLFAGIILFVSDLNWMDPQISPLVPVLKSPWLMFHVAVIVAAYGFFGICFLLGLVSLTMTCFLKKGKDSFSILKINELRIINEMSMIIGLALMSIGTFLGAIWANESWGRYWGWDPKETWALITMVVYAIVIHLRLVKKWNNYWSFSFMSILSFLTVLMTYFGVNMFLSGMHSYGQNSAIGNLLGYGAIFLVFVTLLGFISYRKYKKHNNFIHE